MLLNASMQPEIAAAAKAYAHSEGVSISAVIRTLVAEGLRARGVLIVEPIPTFAKPRKPYIRRSRPAGSASECSASPSFKI